MARICDWSTKAACEQVKQAGYSSRILTLSEGLLESRQRNGVEQEKSSYRTGSAPCSCKSLPVIQRTHCQMQQRPGNIWREFENNLAKYHATQDCLESICTR